VRATDEQAVPTLGLAVRLVLDFHPARQRRRALGAALPLRDDPLEVAAAELGEQLPATRLDVFQVTPARSAIIWESTGLVKQLFSGRTALNENVSVSTAPSDNTISAGMKRYEIKLRGRGVDSCTVRHAIDEQFPSASVVARDLQRV
jgi:hypothetical protein